MWSFWCGIVRHCSLFTSSPTCSTPGHAPVTPRRAGTDLHVAPPNLFCIISTRISVAAPRPFAMTQRSYHYHTPRFCFDPLLLHSNTCTLHLLFDLFQQYFFSNIRYRSNFYSRLNRFRFLQNNLIHPKIYRNNLSNLRSLS